jgi:hypothetical protein
MMTEMNWVALLLLAACRMKRCMLPCLLTADANPGSPAYLRRPATCTSTTCASRPAATGPTPTKPQQQQQQQQQQRVPDFGHAHMSEDRHLIQRAGDGRHGGGVGGCIANGASAMQ